MVILSCITKNTKNRKKWPNFASSEKFYIQKMLCFTVFFESPQFDPIGKEILFDG